jgi:hypothetical protein
MFASGIIFAIAVAILLATSFADKLSLKESGATTIFII